MLLFSRPNPGSGVPIYVQVKQQIRHCVESGALHAGDALPPIRVLAEHLVVNVNTIARVYRELEAEGVIDLRQGVGAFVTAAAAVAAQGRPQIVDARKQVRRLIQDLQSEGLSDAEIQRIVQIAMNEVLDPSRVPPSADDRPTVEILQTRAE
jgi:GntR family transcriptional regulator